VSIHNRRSRVARSEGEGSGHLAASFTDLMASLMVVFILLFVATVSNVAIKEQTVTEVLLGALKAALANGGLDAGGATQDRNDPSAVIIVMPEALLFQRGNWVVEARGGDYLGRMIPVLSSVVCGSELKGQVGSVVVEGHTDTTWFAAKSPEEGAQANLELSQRRSMEVVKTGLATMPYGNTRDCFRRLLCYKMYPMTMFASAGSYSRFEHSVRVWFPSPKLRAESCGECSRPCA
jgi:flagellar motor protein MotB